MKKITILSVFLTLVLVLNAKTKITYQVHALQPGVNNPMSLCSYGEPGVGGEAITWDFTDLKFEKNFVGELSENASSGDFSRSNVILNEFGSKFFFNIDAERTAQIGYLSKSGNVKMEYDVPFVKMKYPFEQGNYFSGAFAGDYLVSGKKISDIEGEYFVEADASGTLLLPEGKTIENVLRIKEEKNYTLTGGTNRAVSIITYRWYNSTHTYPVLVLCKIITETNGKEYVRHQAAYNGEVINYSVIDDAEFAVHSAELFPTFVTNELNLAITVSVSQEAQIIIYDANGKMYAQQAQLLTNGENLLSLSNEVSKLSSGNYFVEVSAGGEKLIRNFICTK